MSSIGVTGVWCRHLLQCIKSGSLFHKDGSRSLRTYPISHRSPHMGVLVIQHGFAVIDAGITWKQQLHA